MFSTLVTRLSLIAILCSGSIHSAVVIPLTGSGATEASGNGFAFRIPNFDGLDVDSEGCVRYNPLEYPAFEDFDIGNLTYDETAITGVGNETLAVNPADFSFNFDDYAQALCDEVAVIGTCSSNVTLSNIQGNGLSFENGVPTSLDFTATVTWIPTLNGFNQSMPYTGKLTVIKGAFIFELSDDPKNWFIGGTNISFEFDLIARPSIFGTGALPPEVWLVVAPTKPHIQLTSVTDTLVTLVVSFSESGGELFRLESSPDLSPNSWSRVVCDFPARTTPYTFTVPKQSSDTKMFYRVREFR